MLYKDVTEVSCKDEKHRSNQMKRSLTLDIHAFGLDKNDLSQNPIIYIFVY